MASINSDTWYQITESRVDFNSSLQYNGDGVYFAKADPAASQYWQFYSINNGQYQIRNKASGVKQLGTCFSSKEVAPSKTQPCMVSASDDKSQKWMIDQWDDGAYRIVNVGNGTGYNMDCHPGNPLYMSSVTAKVPKQPAQHWLFQSLAVIDDGTFSTSIGAAATTTSTSSSAAATTTAASKTKSRNTTGGPTSSSTGQASSLGATTRKSSHGISTGAAVGIGVGIGLLVLILAALFLFYRRRRAPQKPRQTAELYEDPGQSDSIATGKKSDFSSMQEAPASVVRHEMYATPAELPASPAFHSHASQPEKPIA